MYRGSVLATAAAGSVPDLWPYAACRSPSVSPFVSKLSYQIKYINYNLHYLNIFFKILQKCNVGQVTEITIMNFSRADKSIEFLFVQPVLHGGAGAAASMLFQVLGSVQPSYFPNLA